MPPPILYPPPPWTNQDLVLYHGTIDRHVAAILRNIQSNLGRPFRDFGPGFYTTTLLVQAHNWAVDVSASMPGTTPAVIEVTVKRGALASLDALVFVRDGTDADDFWSLVHYCRAGVTDHARVGHRPGYYDVVYGPVAAFWTQKSAMSGADQISFHTPAADAILNNLKISSRRQIV